MASRARGIPITEMPNEITKNIDVSTPIGECNQTAAHAGSGRGW